MYVSDGILRKKRPCGIWVIPALMWSIFNLIALFFQTMYWGHTVESRPRHGECQPKGG